MPPRVSSRSAGLFTFLLWLLGVAGGSAIWIVLALHFDAQCSWIAPLVAIDAACLLRLGGMAPGWRRAAWAVLATVTTIVLANWGIAFTHIGLMMGMDPIDSAMRMGPSLAWTLAGIVNGPVDLVWFAGALLLAWLAGR